MSAGLSTTQICPFSLRRGLAQIVQISCSVKYGNRHNGLSQTWRALTTAPAAFHRCDRAAEVGMPYAALTSGQRPADNATPPLKIQGEGWFASERHLKAWWQLHSARDSLCFLLAHFVDTTCSIIECRRDQIFQHVFVVFKQSRINDNTTNVMLAVDGDFYQTSARLAGDFQRSNFSLNLLHFFLHLLGLFHQVTNAAFSKHKLSLHRAATMRRLI